MRSNSERGRPIAVWTAFRHSSRRVLSKSDTWQGRDRTPDVIRRCYCFRTPRGVAQSGHCYDEWWHQSCWPMATPIRGALLILVSATSGCCSVFNICPPVQSQTSYYDALKEYSSGLNQNVFHNDPNFVVVPATGVIYPIGTLLINGNGVSSCAIDKPLIHVGQSMAPQPPVVWPDLNSALEKVE
jgi:hypothetical protein